MKVLVGLSGGVDSAVAAYLLKKQGYDVTCCFMRNWDSFANNDIVGNPTIKDDTCPQEQDYLDALAVANHLDLPLQRVDFIEEYWDNVFKTFLSEYEKGRTPNPDILCNKYIKFDSFFEYAMKQGFVLSLKPRFATVEHSMFNSAQINPLQPGAYTSDQRGFADTGGRTLSRPAAYIATTSGWLGDQ